MTIVIKNKLNHLLSQWRDHSIYTSAWLKSQGYGSELLQAYKKSKWIESIGTGAYKKTGDQVNWFGALNALQKQLLSSIHVGGRSALELLGKAQYIPLHQSQITLLGQNNITIPKWFWLTSSDTKIQFSFKNLFIEPKTSFGQSQYGFTEFTDNAVTILISTPERAFLEYLDDVPKKYSYTEAVEILENLPSLRIVLLQKLLENCNSVKVNRLFLHLAEKVNHGWLSKVDISKIELGKGKRVIFKNGKFDPKYQITIPKDNHESSIS